MVASARRLTDSARFEAAMLVVILLNAVVLGLETFEGVDEDIGDLLRVLDKVFLGIFTAELLVRFTAVRGDVRAFFSSGWNTFDFIVVTASFTPGLNASLLRIARLLRVVRVVRFLPDLRILVSAVSRSVPGVASLAVGTVLLVYVYGMIGWVIFDDHDPENFDNVLQAMLTMFVLLTLENLPTYLEMGQELSDWTVAFFISYVLLASFLVFNLFIGIVLNSMEEARAADQRAQRQAQREAAAATEGMEDDLAVAVEDRIDELRKALDALQQELQDREAAREKEA
jgi:voltage-gated sodium channel